MRSYELYMGIYILMHIFIIFYMPPTLIYANYIFKYYNIVYTQVRLYIVVAQVAL